MFLNPPKGNLGPIFSPFDTSMSHDIPMIVGLVAIPPNNSKWHSSWHKFVGWKTTFPSPLWGDERKAYSMGKSEPTRFPTLKKGQFFTVKWSPSWVRVESPSRPLSPLALDTRNGWAEARPPLAAPAPGGWLHLWGDPGETSVDVEKPMISRSTKGLSTSMLVFPMVSIYQLFLMLIYTRILKSLTVTYPYSNSQNDRAC